MNARQITSALFWKLRPSTELMIPRFTPAHWWECDLWRLTERRLVSEYEIKLSVEDFRKDFAKEQAVYERNDGWYRRSGTVEKKHDLLAAKSPRGPNRFWFVVAADIAPKVEIPDYAGLIVAAPYGSRATVGIKKQAPVLHGEKWHGDVATLSKTFYWRFWSAEAKAI